MCVNRPLLPTPPLMLPNSPPCAPQPHNYSNTNAWNSYSRSLRLKRCASPSRLGSTPLTPYVRLSTVKTHKSTVAAKEREILARESALLERENQLAVLLSQKDGEIAALQQLVAQLQHQQQFSQHDMEAAVKGAVGRREEELRVLVMKREEEVAGAMVRREEEIMDAVRRREAEVFEAWGAREAEVRKEVEGRAKELEEQVEWMRRREDELRVEEARLEGVRADLEEKFKQWEDGSAKGSISCQIFLVQY